jgi:hypothetical protein
MEYQRIFTFWEPKNHIYGYLELCLETWKKNFPDFEVIILDYTNLHEWLDKDDLHIITLGRKYFELSSVADVVRVMVLHKFGGIWMDVDTIVTGNFLVPMMKHKEQTELLMIDHRIAFLYASKNAQIINDWYEGQINKITDFDRQMKTVEAKVKKVILAAKAIGYLIIKRKKYEGEIAVTWDYLGNSILNPLMHKSTKEQVISLNQFDGYEPELNHFTEITNHRQKYLKFYFNPNKDLDAEKIKSENKPIILLHNSWTPHEYRALSREQILNDDKNFMSRLLQKTALNI